VATSSASCDAVISPDLAAAFLARALPAAETRAIEAHLDGCGECQWLVYAAAAESPTGGGGDDLAGGTLPIGARVGRYRVVRPLAAGGMGVVYIARDAELDRAVALKVVHAAGHARIRTEAQALARVSHPNVVSIYELVEHGSRLYLAMEYVAGTTLERWLAAVPRSARAIVDAFAAAGAGLVAVHAAGLVHGDVKPSNILVGDDGRVRLGDFGLARFAEAEAKLVGGTPAFMAPEQRGGGTATAASDQYAFCRAAAAALGTRASRRVRAVLARGQAEDPCARHGSLAPILAALAPSRRRPRYVIAGVAGGAVAALLAIMVVRRERAHAAQASCEAAAADPRAAWGAARGAVARDGHPAWSGVAAAVDGWVADHHRQVVAACAATHADGTRSPRELRAQLDCLAERAADAGALVGALAVAEEAAASQAIVAVTTLDPPRTCGEPGRRPLARPDDPAIDARVAAVRAELSRITAMERLGLAEPPIAAATSALAAAEVTAYAPVIAEATLRLGSTQLGTAEAADTLLRAATLADRAGDDGLRARALVLALRADYEVARTDRIEELVAQADAALVRASGGALAWAELRHAAGELFADRGDLPAAERELGLAITLRAPAGPFLAARSLASLGIVDAKRGAMPRAFATLELAAELLAIELGPRHPRVAGTHLVIGQAMLADLRAADALPHLERALADAAPDELGHVAAAESSVGFALAELGRPAEALPRHARALATWRAMAVDHPRVAFALLGEGEAHIALGAWDEAIAALEAALAMPSRSTTARAEVAFALAVALTGRGDVPPARAVELAREANAVYAAPDAVADARHRRDRDRVAAWIVEHAR
jgi:eukaryotic-like serine/threonine-protein kinase